MARLTIFVCLLATLVLAGCAGEPTLVIDTVAIPSATAAAAVAPPRATTTPAAATPEPEEEPSQQTTTRAPFAANPAATGFPCPATPTAQASARPLRFVYLEDGRLWLWQEEAAQATEIPVQGRPEGIAVSSDGRLIAYRTHLSGTQSEIWVIGTDGEGERKLVTTDSSKVPGYKPSTDLFSGQYYEVAFAWVAGTHLLSYSYQMTCCSDGWTPTRITRFVDADTGALRFAFEGGEILDIHYAPDGRQLAALTASELRLIDTADGRVAARYGVQSGHGPALSMSYSPDGRWLVAATEPGFIVVDTQSGARRDIAFDYQPYGMGGWSLYPPIEWLGDGPVFYTVFSTDPPEKLYTDETRCTVWRVDAAEGTVIPVYQYTGDVWIAPLSPDRRWLIYRRLRGQEPLELDLYLVDLSAGRELLYDTDPEINAYAWGWAPDGQHFAYDHSTSPRLATVCEKPVPVEATNGGMTWLDGQRYIGSAWHEGSVAYSLGSLGGKRVPIVTLPEPTQRSEPPYELNGPFYGYFLGE